MTAMMLLTANSMHKPQHDNSSLDKQLVDAGLQSLDRIVEETKSEVMQSFQETCTELHRRAQQMRGQAIMMANERHFFSHLPDIQSESEIHGHRDGF
jgi:hypothetical protein